MYMLWFNFIFGSNFVSFLSNGQTHYHTLPPKKTKDGKILNKDKIEPQRPYFSICFCRRIRRPARRMRLVLSASINNWFLLSRAYIVFHTMP